MKKHILSAVVAATLVVASTSSWANGTPAPEVAAAGGLEISGNVIVVTGYQHDDKDAPGAALGGMGETNSGVAAGGAGFTAPNADHFRFVVDQVEIDLQKSFGENIRARADIDFTDFGDTNWRAGDAIDLEQGYVTANLAAGNGIEFLIGKFNAPVGVESSDRSDNWFISYQYPFRFLTPTNVTGAKLYYAFSDLVDLHFAVVNDLNANGFGDSAIPSILTRLGFNWGDEGRESTFGISGGAGPEVDTGVFGASHNAHWDFFGDIDLLVALSDAWNLALEGVYRQSNSVIPNTTNQKATAAWIAANYQASETWDISFRGGWYREWDALSGGSGASTTAAFWDGSALTGFEGDILSGQFGAGYMIADGAKMKLEYRFDFAALEGPALNSDYHSVMAEFDYSF